MLEYFRNSKNSDQVFDETTVKSILVTCEMDECNFSVEFPTALNGFIWANNNALNVAVDHTKTMHGYDGDRHWGQITYVKRNT